MLRRNGKFWQADYYDRYIRDEEHYNNTVEYIERNPVKAGLVNIKEEWIFGSAFNRVDSGRDARAPSGNLNTKE